MLSLGDAENTNTIKTYEVLTISCWDIIIRLTEAYFVGSNYFWIPNPFVFIAIGFRSLYLSSQIKIRGYNRIYMHVNVTDVRV